jgi:ferredoxin-NADP reductase
MKTLEKLHRSPTADYQATVLESRLLTPTIKAIRLQLEGDEFRFLPGQSVWTKFERDGRTFTKIYSIASSPSQCPEVELCISRVGWSSAAMHELAIGQQIKVRAPYGLMTLQTLPDRPRLYIAEGSGIAPLKSQIDWLHEMNFAQPIWLIQANPESPAQLPYGDRWRKLAQTGTAFHYRAAISPETVLVAEKLDLSQFDVEICAIGDRSEQLQAFVLATGANPEQVRSEKFVAF